MLKLQPSPTFKATVDIPTHGGPMPVEFEFKHMTREAFAKFLEVEPDKKRTDEEAIGEFVCGWSGIDVPFSQAALAELVQNYHASARAMFEVYIRELTQASTKN